jgi:hypothetical protein
MRNVIRYNKRVKGKAVFAINEDGQIGKDRVSRLVDSLEIVTSRLLEMTVANNQIATFQTPEMRRLFDTWIKYMSQEVLRIAYEDKTVDIEKMSQETGLSSSSVLSLLMYLERQGELSITRVKTAKGDGRNRDICDCLF